MLNSTPTLILCLASLLLTGCHHAAQRQDSMPGCTDACYRCDSPGMTNTYPLETPVQQIPRQLAPPNQPKSVPPAEPPAQPPVVIPKTKPGEGFLPPVKGPDEADPAAPSADYFPRATSTSK